LESFVEVKKFCISFSELPNAEERLLTCEKKFKASYGNNMERLDVLKVAIFNAINICVGKKYQTIKL
jgi:hypothetical protein